MVQPSESSTYNVLRGAATSVVQAGSIYTQMHSAPLPIPRELPCDVRGFTGRTDHLDRLNGLLKADGRALVISAIAGTAGVGKTALAVHWAHSVREQFPDGQLYTNLRGYDPVDPPAEPGLVLEGFLRTLNVPASQIPSDLEARQRLYRSLLDGKRVLIVLDNAATADQVRPLLPGSDTCLVVVTSRSALASLVAHEGAHRVTIDVLPPAEAINLLTATLGDELPSATLETLAELCVRLPLALRIIAERVAASSTPIAQLVAELASEQSRLEALSPDDDTNTVRAVFSSSYRALAPDDARAFRLLGLHPGPDISEAAADALTGGLARRSLRRLVNAHLLEAHGTRYRFHDLLRLYAAERANVDEAPSAQQEALKRLSAWYVHTVANSQRIVDPHYRRIEPDPLPPGVTPLTFSTKDDVNTWFNQEHTNLVAVTRCAGERKLDVQAWQLPALLTRHYMKGQRWQEWEPTTTVGLEAVRRVGNLCGEAEILNSLGILHVQLLEFEDSHACHERALNLRRLQGDRQGESVTLNNICFPHKQAGRLESAYECLRRSLMITQEIGYTGWQRTVLLNLAHTCGELGRWQEALDWCDEASALPPDQVDAEDEAELIARGETYRGLGRTQEAIRCHEKAWNMVLGRGMPMTEVFVLNYLGRAYRDAGRVHEAIEIHQQTVATCKEHNAKRFLAISLQDLADAEDRLGG
ncbi:tetratricopeptide repeat protein [Lentzea kentuckyensis]|uniref:tetratricopeptide repeat protein n=1 Tax=Lentzea kentuckyensis TaxID=360086 RepID=UPI001302B8FF|nr:tetratricopeptide repeat protein [Lentzea kentuckyensis]